DAPAIAAILIARTSLALPGCSTWLSRMHPLEPLKRIIFAARPVAFDHTAAHVVQSISVLGSYSRPAVGIARRASLYAIRAGLCVPPAHSPRRSRSRSRPLRGGKGRGLGHRFPHHHDSGKSHPIRFVPPRVRGALPKGPGGLRLAGRDDGRVVRA